jgi:hypothetical protein
LSEPTIRGPQKADVPFIMDSWLSSLRPIYQSLPDDLFFPAYRQLIKRILATSQVRVLVEGDRILGYAVSNDAEGILQWLYLRKPNEQQAQMLLAHLPPKPNYTMRTRQSRELLGSLQEWLLRRFKPDSADT